MSKNVLYGGELSYFTGKARAYLNWKGVDYEERLATRDVYKNIIVARIGYPMIPVLVTPEDEIIQDTTEIIDHFEARDPESSVFPAGPRQRLAAHLLELYGDEWLVIPAMHYRWAHNRDFAYGEFGKLAAPDADEATQVEAGKKAATRFEGAVALLGATAEMADAVEASYLALLDEMNAHFSEHDYLFGSRPSVGDFGLIGPLYAHLYRDPASGEIMKERAPAVARWVERMQEPAAPKSGAFLDDDEIPATLLPILKRMSAEQGPCLIDLVVRVAAFKSENPDADIPRAVGMHPFTVEGKTGQRLVFPYTQWMLQRATDHLARLKDHDRSACEALLRDTGFDALIDIQINAPVRRENHKLVWA
ncbi:MAG: glutathione S-transferase family protein [Pseudomonadota bacterium]